MNYKKFALIFLFLILLNIVVAQEEVISVQEQSPILENPTQDENLSSNETNETAPVQLEVVEEIIFKNFIPREFKLGDSQFSMQVQNNKNETIKGVIALVSGKGFSTYEVTPIDSLEPEEKGYILVSGNFRESGLINLTIKIAQKSFYQEVNVLGESEEDLKKAEELVKREVEKKKSLADLSSKVEALKQNYSNLEIELAQKEKEGYDIKNINLDELKKDLRETQASILGEHLEEARITLNLATEEYSAVEKKIETMEKLPFIKRFKEQVILFSSIAGAIITLFALYELLKKKSKDVATTIGSIKPKTENKEEPKIQQQEISKEAEIKVDEADKQEEEKVAEEEAEKPEKKKPEKKKKRKKSK